MDVEPITMTSQIKLGHFSSGKLKACQCKTKIGCFKKGKNMMDDGNKNSQMQKRLFEKQKENPGLTSFPKLAHLPWLIK